MDKHWNSRTSHISCTPGSSRFFHLASAVLCFAFGTQSMTYTGAGIAYQCGMLEDKLDEHMVRIEALLVGWGCHRPLAVFLDR